MTRSEIASNIKKNRELLRGYLKPYLNPYCKPWVRKNTCYLLGFFPFRIGCRSVDYVRWASIDLTADHVIAEDGKLIVRLLSVSSGMSRSVSPSYFLEKTPKLQIKRR